MIKDKWQQELEHVKLSAEAKRRMQQRIERRPVSRTFKLVLPSFIVLAVLFFMLTVGNNSPTLKRLASDGEGLLQVDHRAFFATIFWWLFAAFLLYVAFVLQMLLLPMFTKRWDDHAGVVRYRQVMTRMRTSVVYMLLFIGAFAASAFSLLVLPLLFVKGALLYKVYCLAFVLLNCLALVGWSIRRADAPSCPHCREHINKKAFRKVLFGGSDLSCPTCQARIYVSRKSRLRAGYITFFNVFIIFSPWVGIPIWISIPFILLFYVVLFKYMLYYMYEFTIKDEFLW